MITPSPQIYVQTEFEVKLPAVQDQPNIAAEQSDLHPPRPELTPSSQTSMATTLESPQIGVHLEVKFASFVQVQPASTKQNWSHPFKLVVSKSSHCSSFVVIPSPQIGMQVEGPDTLPPVQA